MLDIIGIRKDFPILLRKINNKPLVYLDSAATSLKPQSVINKITEYYTKYTANIYRGIYTLSEEATQAYEEVRIKVQEFIGAPEKDEIIFTRNTTESINLLASSIAQDSLHAGDEIVVSIMDHHSNFVPWQQLAKKKSLVFKVLNLDSNYQIDIDSLEKIITRKTKVLAITALSNVLGTIVPIREIVRRVKRITPHCIVVVDGAQAIPHTKINVADWQADFVAFSSHKMLGPTGVGVLWGKMELLEQLSPYQYGGEMIEEVHVDKTLFKKPPHKFEAGTPHIAGVIGIGAAVDYLQALGMDEVRKHEVDITDYALKALARINGVVVYGQTHAKNRGGVIAFTLKGVHAHDIAQILDQDNICIRAGHHCAMPLHEYLKLSATVRASFYVYTTKEDVDALVEGLEKVKKLFQ